MTTDQTNARCTITDPHGPHEWYGKPPAIRRDCPGVAPEPTTCDICGQLRTTLARVTAECDAIDADTAGDHDEDADGQRDAVRRIRAAASLGSPRRTQEPGAPAVAAVDALTGEGRIDGR